MIRETPTLSERTRRAVQDYTAIATIVGAVEHMRESRTHGFTPDPLAVGICLAFAECNEHERVRMPPKLTRWARALDMVGPQDVMRRRLR